SVSKRHAVLVWDEDAQRCLVKDLGSTNGTYLNDRKLTRDAVIRDGDIVSFGEAQFWYLLTDTLHAKLSRGGGSGRSA
ncbi:MAG TPA: FHA domain-containing protein, partial [Myxococcaceae bacterium]|nr:FHA domain-containing protein [Myxococcaceae bacterium]